MGQAPESTAKKAFDFNSTVDSRRLSTLVYHSAHGISNILPNIRRVFPADRLPHGWPTVDSGACNASHAKRQPEGQRRSSPAVARREAFAERGAGARTAGTDTLLVVYDPRFDSPRGLEGNYRLSLGTETIK